MKTYVHFSRFQNLTYYFATFIGVAPFSVKNNDLRPLDVWRKTYAMILAVLNVLWIIYLLIVNGSQGSEITSLNRFVLTVVCIVYGGNVCSILLTFMFRSNSIIDIINQISMIKDELKNFGIENDCQINWKTLYMKMILMNSAILVINVSVQITSDDYLGRDTLFWIGNIMATMHISNSILIFVAIIIYIGQLFESLNNKLRGTIQPNRNLILPCDDQQNSSVHRIVKNRRIADQPTQRIIIQAEDIQLSVKDIEKIGKLHRELCDLVKSFTDLSTIPILFVIVRNFSNILSNCYTMYMHIFVLHDVFETTEAFLSSIQHIMSWMALSLLDLFLIAHACTTMSRMGNATKVVLHEAWNKFYPEELRDELCKLSLQLLNNPVTVSLFGFFDLGYSYLYKISCAVVAYLIIMIQLDRSPRNPGT